MRKRRADRCVLRAEVALEAGFEEDARAALDEARRLDASSPDFETLRESVAKRRRDEAERLRRDRQRRHSRYAAAVVLATAIGAAILARPSDQAGTTPTTQALASTEAAAHGVGTAGIERASFVTQEASAAGPSTEAPSPRRDEPKTPEEPAKELPRPAERPEPPPAPRERPERGDDPPAASAPLPPVSFDAAPPAALPAAAVPAAGPVSELPGTPAAPPPVPPPAPRVEPAADTSLPEVRAVLARYESAYSTLDAPAAQSVWPGVDGRSLARAFESLESQRVSLGRCSISIDGSAASATCSGSATWTPKVGGGTRTEPRRWSFQLARSGGAWQIVRADVR